MTGKKKTKEKKNNSIGSDLGRERDSTGQQIIAAQRRLKVLIVRASSLKDPLLNEALEELSTSLEELGVSEEELCQQNEELMASRQAQEAERKRYQDLFEFTPDGYLVTSPEGIIKEANRAAAFQLGLPQDYLQGKPLRVYIKERRFFDTLLRRLQKTEKKAIEEWEGILIPRKKGPFYARIIIAPIDDDQGKLIGLRWLIRDITERKRSEEALKISETRYRRLFETSREGILILDAETGQISDVNPFLVEMLGYSFEDFLGKKLWEIGPFKNIKASKATFLELQSKGYVRFEDLPLETKDGRLIAVEFVSNVYLVNHHKVIQCNIRDITERKRLAEALQKAHNELEQRVEERTSELRMANEQLGREIEEHRQAEESLRKAFSEIKKLKDQLEVENIYFRQENRKEHQFDAILGQSDGLKYVLYRAEQVAPTSTTVLILGETGTGKELIAAAIHNLSPRRDRPLITVNCAALPANLIESELFGREKGAFTGADTRQIGRFEVANGSTICLDEIGELPLEMQAKLLRVIQHNEFERLGSSQTIKVDVRIMATTNRNLDEEVRQGRFRQDLYYRLNVFPITVPPLRQRIEDIPLLVQAFADRYARKLGKEITSIPKETMKALKDYPWPGNIRELESILERAMILCPGPVLQLADKLAFTSSPLSAGIKTLEERERNQILKTLSETRWRIGGKDGAAIILGLHPSTLRARMHKLGILRPETKGSDL